MNMWSLRGADNLGPAAAPTTSAPPGPGQGGRARVAAQAAVPGRYPQDFLVVPCAQAPTRRQLRAAFRR